MASGMNGFPNRNGFALHADLQHPALKRHLHLCQQESEEFSGESHFDWSRQWEYPFVVGNLPAEGAGRRLLDAGSGYRFFAPMLARRGFEVDACDLDATIGPKYDEIAARYDVDIEFAQQDLSTLTYADESFDFVCCISVLEHTREPEEIVREFKRCLKRGGALLLTFDVSVHGDRDLPLATARDLVALLEEEFEPAVPFSGRQYFDSAVLAESEDVLRTRWFRTYQPELLPWRFVSRAGLRNLLRGKIGRPFFDLAVVGLVLRKPA